MPPTTRCAACLIGARRQGRIVDGGPCPVVRRAEAGRTATNRASHRLAARRRARADGLSPGSAPGPRCSPTGASCRPTSQVDETIGALGGTFTYPFRYGYSCVGRIEALAPDVEDLTRRRSGLRLPAAPGAVRRRPLPISYRSRHSNRASPTLLPYVETALQVTLDAGPVLGETVVVSGLGVLGLLVATLRRARRWSRRRDRAAGVASRASQPISASWPSSPSTPPMRSTASGVPIAIECSGNPAALASVARVARPRGHRAGRFLVRLESCDPPARRPLPSSPADDPQHPGLDHPRRTVGTLVASSPPACTPSISPPPCRSPRSPPTRCPFEQAGEGYARVDARRTRCRSHGIRVWLTHVPGRHRRRVLRPARDARGRGPGRHAPLPRLPARGVPRTRGARRSRHGLRPRRARRRPRAHRQDRPRPEPRRDPSSRRRGGDGRGVRPLGSLPRSPANWQAPGSTRSASASTRIPMRSAATPLLRADGTASGRGSGVPAERRHGWDLRRASLPPTPARGRARCGIRDVGRPPGYRWRRCRRPTSS